MKPTDRRLKTLERRAGLEAPPQTVAYLSYRDEADRLRQLAALPPTIRQLVMLPKVCESVEQWQAEVDAASELQRLEEAKKPPIAAISAHTEIVESIS